MALPEDGLDVRVAVSGDVMAYDESLVKPLEGATKTVRLTRTRPSTTLTVHVSPDEYLVKCVVSPQLHPSYLTLKPTYFESTPTTCPCQCYSSFTTAYMCVYTAFTFEDGDWPANNSAYCNMRNTGTCMT